MRKTICLLVGCTAVGLFSQIIGQAADAELDKTKARQSYETGYGTVSGSSSDEQLAERYLEAAKRKADLLVRDGRSQEIAELTKAFEEEVEQLEAAQRKKKDEKQAEEKLMAVRASLEEIMKAHPNSRAAILAEQAIVAMQAIPRFGAPIGQNESPFPFPQPTPQALPTYPNK